MPERRLNDWFDSYLVYVHNTEPSILYKQWVGVSIIAAVLQRKCYTEWVGNLYPNMYIILVGPPGARKGTAMLPAYDFLRAMGDEVRIASEFSTKEVLVKRLKTSTRADTLMLDFGNGPVATPVNHSSLTIINEELTVFLGYKQNELLSFLCNWYDCREEFSYETIGRGKEFIKGVWVNLLGATTPELLALSMPKEAVGSGFSSRVLFAYAPGKGKTVPLPIKTEAEKELEVTLKQDLERILILKGEFRRTKDWEDLIVAFYIDQEENPVLSEHKDLAAYVERRVTHMVKLSMIFSASRSDDMLLTKEDFFRALALLKDTERVMPRVFQGMGMDRYAKFLPDIMRYIAGLGQVRYSSLLYRFMRDVNSDDLKKILDILVQVGAIEVKPEGTGRDMIIIAKDTLSA